jgi:AcrR family transcriptional regulator
MPSKPTKKTLRPRRTNAERSAATRNKLIEAAIDTLYRSGYTATTTIEVAKRARVSRGAMLHQFPARVDLLLAVAQHIIDTNSRYRREQLGSESGLKRFYAAADVSWAVHSQPSAIALLEILMATRSDKDLRKGFEGFRKVWIEARSNAAARMAADLGVSNVADIESLITLHQASMRGLAIEMMFVRESEGIDKARRLLADYDRLFAEKLVAAAKSAGS